MISRRTFFGASAAFLAGGCMTVGDNKCNSKCACAAAGKVPFKFGMAGYTFYRCSVAETLEVMKTLDMHYLCIKDFHLPMKSTDAQIAAFKQQLADAQVTGYAVGPIYMTSDDEAKRAFEYAAKVGVKTVICVPAEFRTDKKTRYASRKRCETVSALCTEYDMCAAIHNHGPDIPYCYPTGQSTFDMIKDLDKRLGLCLDIGHDFRAGGKPEDSIRNFAGRIYDMHVKNVKYDPVNNIAKPMPRGDMDMVEVVRALAETHYTGCCSLEYESFPGKNVKPGIKLADIAESVGYFKGIIRSIEKGA